MAVGSYAPIYTHIKEQLMNERARVEYFTLECLAQHADDFGLTWIGDQSIGRKIGYADSTVETAIQSLVARGWIKCIYTYNKIRRVEMRDILIHPEVLYVRDEHFEKCLEMFIVSNHVQPDTEPDAVPDTKPESVTQNQNHHHHPTHPNEEKDSDAPKQAENGDNPFANMAKKQKKPTARSAETAQSAQPEEPLAAAAPRESLKPYNVPLADGEKERRAQDIAAFCDTRISQARQMVAAYPSDVMTAAFEWLISTVKGGGKVKSKAGLLRWWLDANAVQDVHGADYPLPENLPLPGAAPIPDAKVSDDEPY